MATPFSIGTTAPANPATNIQWNAIQNGANNNSLVSQLFAGKPKTQTPSVVAASSQVKSPTAPQSTPVTPVATQPTFAGGTNAQGQGIGSIVPTGTSQTQITNGTSNSSVPITGNNMSPAPTFSGIVGSLANTSQQGSPIGQQITAGLANTAQQGSPAAQSYTAQTANYGAGNIPIGQEADNIAKQYSQKISDAETAGGQQYTGYLTGGGGPIGLGRAGAVQNALSQYVQGQSAAETAALQGTAQELTGQNQAATATNEAAGQANTGQANIQSGLASAGGLANTAQANTQSGLTSAGSLESPGNAFIQVPFNQQLVGADGQPIGGSSGSGQLQSAVVNAINLIKSGSGYSNAIVAANLGQFGPQGTSALLNALGPNFNVNSSDADAAAVAQNINTTGTAATSAANTAYNSAVQKVAENTATYQGLTGVSQNLNDTLAGWTQNGQLTDVNAALNTVAGHTSNAQYQQFITALGNAQASYQAALGAAGVTPTKADQDALAALNPNSSASTINAALNQLSTDAHSLLIVPAYQQQQTYGQQLGIQ